MTDHDMTKPPAGRSAEGNDETSLHRQDTTAMTSTNNSKTGERKLTDFPKVRGTTYRKVAQGQLRELGMWVETDSPARWGRQHAGVYLAGAGCVGRINDKQQAEVQEWAIEAGLKLDLATNVLAATQAQAQIEVADKIRAAVNGVGVN